jgi:hypothetical protein
MNEMMVRGVFEKPDDRKLILDEDLQQKYNLRFCKIRRDFHYVVKWHYALRISSAPPGQEFRVLEVIKCQEEPLLRFYAPLHLKKNVNLSLVKDNPLLNLFQLYTKTPFLNTDTKTPTFLSHDPSWTIREYEMAINAKAEPWVVSAHQLFLSFYRRFYYNGTRCMKIPPNTPTQSLRFLTRNRIFAVDAQQNLLSTPTFLEESGSIRTILNELQQKHTSARVEFCTLIHCHKHNEALMMYYHDLMETMENAIFFTANMTLFSYMCNTLVGLRTPFFDPISFILIDNYSRYAGRILIIDSANKIGVKNFLQICRRVMPKRIILFGNKYEGGASCFYGEGGNVFLACHNMGFPMEDLKTLSGEEEMQLATINRRLFQNVERIFKSQTMPATTEDQIVFDCVYNLCHSSSSMNADPNPNSISKTDPNSNSKIPKVEPNANANLNAKGENESQVKFRVVCDAKGGRQKRKFTERVERADTRPPVALGAMICVDNLALYGKLFEATWTDMSPVVRVEPSDSLYLGTRNYTLRISYHSVPHQIPLTTPLKNSILFHIQCLGTAKHFPARYSGIPVTTVICNINEHTSLNDIFAAFKYAKNNFKIILPTPSDYSKLAQLRIIRLPTLLFF